MEQTADCGTDHRLVMMTMKLIIHTKYKKKGTNVRKKQLGANNKLNSKKKIRLDLSSIITKAYGGWDKYNECIRNQSVLEVCLEEKLRNAEFNDSVDGNYSVFCEVINL